MRYAIGLISKLDGPTIMFLGIFSLTIIVICMVGISFPKKRGK